MISQRPIRRLSIPAIRSIPRPLLILVTVLLTSVAIFLASQIRIPPSEWDEVQSRGGPSNVAFSPDKRTIATSALVRGVQLWYQADKKLIDSLGDNSLTPQLEFSPNGYFFAWSYQHYAFLYNIEAGHMYGSPITAKNWIYAMAFSPDSEMLAVAGGAIEIWNVYGVESFHTTIAETNASAVGSLAFSPDGKMLAAGLSDGSVHVWGLFPGKEAHTLGGKELVSMNGPSGYVSTVAFSRDMRSIAGGGEDGSTWFWSLKDGKELWKVSAATDSVASIAFSPDSKVVVVARNGNNSLPTLDRHSVVTALRSSDGTQAWTFDKRSQNVVNVEVSPDGRQIIADYQDGKTLTWPLP